jgi:hypothetical protein
MFRFKVNLQSLAKSQETRDNEREESTVLFRTLYTPISYSLSPFWNQTPS